MSIKRAVQYCLFSSASIISLMSLCICSIVECLFLNPNWWSGINFFFSIVRFMRSYIIFSSILENTGSSDIGLQDAVWCGSLPGLGSIMICASFHSLGKYWILSIALNIMVISPIVFGGRFFKILPLIRSIPGALLFFCFLDYVSNVLCCCFRYGVLLVSWGTSGLRILIRIIFEVAVVDIIWCKCVAKVIGEFFSLFFVASCPCVICFSDCWDWFYWLLYFFRNFS